MAITPKKEQVEQGKTEIKVPKKKVVGKKAAPQKLEKVDILKSIEYKLTEVNGSQRTTDKQTHLLELKVGQALVKIGLWGKPSDVSIKKMHDDLIKRK